MEKHYFNMEINSITTDWIKKIEWEKVKTLFLNSSPIPEGENIKIFSWIMSQNFEKGEVSRNRYKYKQDWWKLDNYARLPIILWQHDDRYWGIGFTQELFIDSNSNLCWIFYVDTDMLEPRHKNQIEKWYVKAISTWAITLEDWFEDEKTWEILTFSEAEKKYGWDNVISTLWWALDTWLSYIITKAELLENSMVTIGSNFWAIAKSENSINDEMKKRADELQKLRNSQTWEKLLTNQINMVDETKEDSITDIEATTPPEVVDEIEVKEEQPTEVEKLENRIVELENAFALYKSDVEAKFNSLSVNIKKNTREEEKNIILAKVVKSSVWEVKNLNDFKNKYFNK